MSLKFSRNRIPQPTPKVCLKGITPPNPLPEPEALNIALTYAPAETAPTGPPAQADLCLNKLPGTAIYESPDHPTGINFIAILYLDYASYTAHLTVAVRTGSNVYDYINYYGFVTSGPPAWTEEDPIETAGAGNGTFCWLTYS